AQKLSQAAVAYRKALERFPDEPTILRRLELTAEKIDKLLDRKLDRNAAAESKAKGDALRAKGDLKGAADAYEKAIEFDPTDPSLYCALGHALLVGYKRANDQTACRKSLERYPKAPAAHVALAIALFYADSEAAVAACRNAIALDPTYCLAHVWLGDS